MDRSGRGLCSGSEAAVKANGSAVGQQREEKRAGRGKKKCGRERAAAHGSGRCQAGLWSLDVGAHYGMLRHWLAV